MNVAENLARLKPLAETDPIPDLAGRIARFRTASYPDLPDDYLAFLQANGHWMFFPDNQVDAGKRKVRVESLFGLDGSKRTLFTEFATYAERLPPGIIPIGDSGGGGDLICLDIQGLRPGTVLHWNHEREVDAAGERQPDFFNMVQLADSFSLLLDRVTLVAPPTGNLGIKRATLRF